MPAGGSSMTARHIAVEHDYEERLVRPVWIRVLLELQKRDADDIAAHENAVGSHTSRSGIRSSSSSFIFARGRIILKVAKQDAQQIAREMHSKHIERGRSARAEIPLHGYLACELLVEVVVVRVVRVQQILAVRAQLGLSRLGAALFVVVRIALETVALAPSGAA